MNFRQSLCLSTAVLAVGGASPVWAQTADQPGAAALEEIVITAERRDSSVQKTALNITAVTSDGLSRQGIASARDLSAAVPGFSMTQANPNAFIGLYGLASGGGSMYTDAVMSYNYGGVALARQTSSASALYDVERIEVLKGPQGTLYGKNATVGALNVILARPTDVYEGALSVTRGNYNTFNTTGMINMPISDQLAARAAFQTTKHDGYLSSGYNDAKNYGARFSVEWKPTDAVSLLLWADAYRNRAKGNIGTFRYWFANQEWINPSDPWDDLKPAGSCADQRYCPSDASVGVGGVNAQPNPAQGATGNGFADISATGLGRNSVVGNDGYDESDQNVFTAELNWHTPFGLATVIGSHVDTKIHYKVYSNSLLFFNDTKAKQNSLEARLASEGDSRLKWVVGGFYFDETQNANQQNIQNSGNAVLYTPDLTDTSYAAFADATFSVTERLRLLAGIRYTNEEKTQNGYSIVNGVPLTGASSSVAFLRAAGLDCYLGANAPGQYAVVTDRVKYPFIGAFPYPSNICFIPNGGSLTTDNTSGKIGLEFDVTPTSMLYGTIKTGFRSAGFTSGTQNTYGPEKLTAYEVGSKNRFLDSRLQANVTGFYWDYKGQQLSQLQQYFFNGVAVGQTAFPTNIDGKLYGVEMDFLAAITPNDRLRLDAVWTKGTLDKTPFFVFSGGVTSALTDVDRYNLPEWVLTAGYNHIFELGDRGALDAGVQLHYETDTNMRLGAANAVVPGDIRDAYALWDADVTYHAPNGKWDVQLYVRNIGNEAVPGVGSSGQVAPPTFFRPSFATSTTANGSTAIDTRSATLNPPRTYGVKLTARFGGEEAAVPPPPPAPPSPPPPPPPPPAPPPVAYEAKEFIVYFPFDQYVLTPEASTVIAQAADYAKAGNATKVVVVGHADTSGSAAYNVKLSERRAKATADALVGAGVNQTALAVDWKGEAEPAVATGDGVKEPLNRRSTININF